ncbi:hypothetical protein HaLaN_26513, partial [Haematococcus lacustris]|jgi:hypothetical protein
MEQN